MVSLTGSGHVPWRKMDKFLLAIIVTFWVMSAILAVTAMRCALRQHRLYGVDERWEHRGRHGGHRGEHHRGHYKGHHGEQDDQDEQRHRVSNPLPGPRPGALREEDFDETDCEVRGFDDTKQEVECTQNARGEWCAAGRPPPGPGLDTLRHSPRRGGKPGSHEGRHSSVDDDRSPEDTSEERMDPESMRHAAPPVLPDQSEGDAHPGRKTGVPNGHDGRTDGHDGRRGTRSSHDGRTGHQDGRQDGHDRRTDGQERLPGGQDGRPGGQDGRPGGQDGMPGDQDKRPGSQDRRPGSQDRRPGGVHGGSDGPDGIPRDGLNGIRLSGSGARLREPELPAQGVRQRTRRMPCLRMRVRLFLKMAAAAHPLRLAHLNFTQAANFPACSFSSCDSNQTRNRELLTNLRHHWEAQIHQRTRCLVNRKDPSQVIIMGQRLHVRGFLASPGFQITFWSFFLGAVCFIVLVIRRCMDSKMETKKVAPEKLPGGGYIVSASSWTTMSDKEREAFALSPPVVSPVAPNAPFQDFLMLVPPTYDESLCAMPISHLTAPPAYVSTVNLQSNNQDSTMTSSMTPPE